MLKVKDKLYKKNKNKEGDCFDDRLYFCENKWFLVL